MCYYFNEIMKIEGFDLMRLSWVKKQTKIFWFMTFCPKVWFVQNLCVLCSLNDRWFFRDYDVIDN